MRWLGKKSRCPELRAVNLKLLARELGQQEAETLLEGDTVTGVLVIGREAGGVSRLGDSAGRGEFLVGEKKTKGK